MAKVNWTNFALSNLNEIAEFIALDSPKFAQITIKKLYSKVEILKSYPKMGRVVPEQGNENVRELIDGSYRIIYEIYDAQIFILAVHHSARLLSL